MHLSITAKPGDRYSDPYGGTWVRRARPIDAPDTWLYISQYGDIGYWPQAYVQSTVVLLRLLPAVEPTPDLLAVLAEVDDHLDHLVPGDWWIEIGSHDRAATVHVPAEGSAGPTHLFACPQCGTAAETEIDHADFCAAAPRLLRSLREAVRRNGDAGTASQI